MNRNEKQGTMKTLREAIQLGIDDLGIDEVLHSVQTFAVDTFPTEKMTVRMTPRQKTKLVRLSGRTKQSQNDVLSNAINARLLLDEIQELADHCARIMKCCGIPLLRNQNVFHEAFEELPGILLTSGYVEGLENENEVRWPELVKDILKHIADNNVMLALSDINFKFQCEDDQIEILEAVNQILTILETKHNFVNADADHSATISALRFRQKFYYSKYTEYFPQYPTIKWEACDYANWKTAIDGETMIYKLDVPHDTDSMVFVDKLFAQTDLLMQDQPSTWNIGIAAKTRYGSINYLIESMAADMSVETVLNRAYELYQIAASGTNAL